MTAPIGLPYSQLGYDLGDPMRSLVRLTHGVAWISALAQL